MRDRDSVSDRRPVLQQATRQGKTVGMEPKVKSFSTNVFSPANANLPWYNDPKVAAKVAAKFAGSLLVGTGALVGVSRGIILTDAGMMYVVQNNLNGSLTVISEPGVHWCNPLFSSVTPYNKVITTCFEMNENRSIRVRFADTYVGNISASFRFKLPADHTEMIKIHNEFRSHENLMDVLLARNARDVTVITATQYTGEEVGAV